MSTLSLRLPETIHRELRELASREGVSLNHLINSAVGEKLASLKTLDYLRERGARGSRRAFLRVLTKAADHDPIETDRIVALATSPRKASSGRARK